MNIILLVAIRGTNIILGIWVLILKSLNYRLSIFSFLIPDKNKYQDLWNLRIKI